MRSDRRTIAFIGAPGDHNSHDDDDDDDGDCMIYISIYKNTNLKIYGSKHDIACYLPLVQASVQFQVLCIFS